MIQPNYKSMFSNSNNFIHMLKLTTGSYKQSFYHDTRTNSDNTVGLFTIMHIMTYKW